MDQQPRLIEVAFPLKQASLGLVNEKGVRHGHISTLHTWLARRPLAACQAALMVTLLHDPRSPQKPKDLQQKIDGKVVPEVQREVGWKTIVVGARWSCHTAEGTVHSEGASDGSWE